jgi:hypothetical protein
MDQNNNNISDISSYQRYLLTLKELEEEQHPKEWDEFVRRLLEIHGIEDNFNASPEALANVDLEIAMARYPLLKEAAPNACAIIEGRQVPLNEIVVDLPCRPQKVCKAIEGNEPREQPNKLATYQAWFASPFVENARSAARVPRYLYLDLSKHVVHNISRFRLRAHTLRVESGLWHNRVFSCNCCDCQDIQDEKHVVFYCKDARACALRKKYRTNFRNKQLIK